MLQKLRLVKPQFWKSQNAPNVAVLLTEEGQFENTAIKTVGLSNF